MEYLERWTREFAAIQNGDSKSRMWKNGIEEAAE
jgi:hypothetical protein